MHAAAGGRRRTPTSALPPLALLCPASTRPAAPAAAVALPGGDGSVQCAGVRSPGQAFSDRVRCAACSRHPRFPPHLLMLRVAHSVFRSCPLPASPAGSGTWAVPVTSAEAVTSPLCGEHGACVQSQCSAASPRTACPWSPWCSGAASVLVPLGLQVPLWCTLSEHLARTRSCSWFLTTRTKPRGRGEACPSAGPAGGRPRLRRRPTTPGRWGAWGASDGVLGTDWLDAGHTGPREDKPV